LIFPGRRTGVTFRFDEPPYKHLSIINLNFLAFRIYDDNGNIPFSWSIDHSFPPLTQENSLAGWRTDAHHLSSSDE
jgi:hypothetical protein